MNKETLSEVVCELDGISTDLETVTELIAYLSTCIASGKEAPSTVLEMPTAELVRISNKLGEEVKTLYNAINSKKEG